MSAATKRCARAVGILLVTAALLATAGTASAWHIVEVDEHGVHVWVPGGPVHGAPGHVTVTTVVTVAELRAQAAHATTTGSAEHADEDAGTQPARESSHERETARESDERESADEARDEERDREEDDREPVLPAALPDIPTLVDPPVEPPTLLERVRGAAAATLREAEDFLTGVRDPEPVPSAAAREESTPRASGGGVAGPVQPAGDVTPATAVAVLAVTGAAAVGWASGAFSGAAGVLRRVLGSAFGVGGFTRLARANLLDHEARESLATHVRGNPGASLKDLMDATGLGRSTVTYHLHVLDREGFVTSRREGRRRLYFPVGAKAGPGPEDAAAFAALRNGTARAIAVTVTREPGVDQRGLCEALSVKPSLAHWHAGRLEHAGVLRRERDGRRVRYYPGPLAEALGLAEGT